MLCLLLVSLLQVQPSEFEAGLETGEEAGESMGADFNVVVEESTGEPWAARVLHLSNQSGSAAGFIQSWCLYLCKHSFDLHALKEQKRRQEAVL